MINDQNYIIYFGNKKTSPFSSEEFKSLISNQKEKLRNKIQEKFPTKNYFLHQNHSTNGIILKNQFDASLENEGDFIITNIKNIAIGVFTADCLPIIFYDTLNNVAAVTHAGWKGSINNIAKITYENMKTNFGTNCKATNVYFGPSAKSCCYEVSDDFQNKIKDDFLKSAIIFKQNKFYFDMPLYNRLILERCGFENFDLLQNICTICNIDFCSARRERINSRRQINTIMLK